jgi:CRP/FNR family transcriptional regulator, anaerobic regulatory protein
MSRGDIADYLGLTIETVSRTLTGLRRDRLIGMPNKHMVQILDPDALNRLGNG